MIYIIISNIGLAIMTVVVYIRYSALKLSSGKQIRDLYAREHELCRRVDEAIEEKKALEEKNIHDPKIDSKDVKRGDEGAEALLREIDELRKDKEKEIKLRLEAEKQIELALLKTEDIQKRMDDWRIVQEAVMKDSKDAIIKVGDDLYKKIHESNQLEIETSKNLMNMVKQNVEEYLDKIVADKTHSVAGKSHAEHHHIAVSDPAKKLIPNLVSTMKARGYEVGKNYFLPENFDDEKGKSMLCEIALISGKKLYLVDFKSCRYFEEYLHLSEKNKSAATEFLTQKLDRYISYLTNHKYHDSILKTLSTTKIEFEKSSIIFTLQSKDDLQVMKETGHYEKALKAGLEIMDFDELNRL